MKQLADQAIVLSRLDYGEAARIVTFLTKTHGKISAMAKGVRKPKSKLAGGIELFSVADITYIEGKSDIKTLVTAQVHTHYGSIASDITRSMTAYDVLKYTNLYTETICEDEYFALLHAALAALNDVMAAPELVWVWFGVRLLEQSGHGLNLATDPRGAQLNPDDQFMFDYQDMAFYAHQGGVFTSRHIKLLRLCQRTRFATVQSVAGAPAIAKELRQLIAECTKFYSR